MKMIKNITRIFVVALLAFTMFTTNTFGQVKDDIGTMPFVPIDIVVKGRQAIATHMIIGVDHAVIGLTGRSIVAPDSWYLPLQSLTEMGYIHRGSFDELSKATANIPFNPDVIPTPEGWYDVRVAVTYYQSDGKVALQGNGYLNIWVQPDGNLVADKFNPYVTLPNLIGVRLKGNCVQSVMWIPRGYGDPVQLPLYGDQEGLYLALENRMLENGYLAIADCNGEVVAWDLQTSKAIEGKHVFALLGKVQCGEVLPIKSPEKPVIDVGDQVRFYFDTWNGVFVGRMPTIEVPFNSAVKDYFTLQVPIWNTSKGMVPDEAYVTPIAMYGPTQGLELHKEYPVSLNKQGQLGLSLPAGIYHIRTVFYNLHDWTEYPGKG